MSSFARAWGALLAVTASSITPAQTQPASGGVDVVLETSEGMIEITVYPDRAPLSAGDFLRYVDEGLYQNAGFYRVVTLDNDNGSPVIEVIQGGLLEQEPGGPSIAHETTEATGISHRDGAVSLGRTEPGTASAAAFFICIGDQPALDYGGTRNPDRQGFAAFGRVTAGMDVVRRIQRLPADAPSPDPYTAGQLLARPVRILSARRSVAAPPDEPDTP